MLFPNGVDNKEDEKNSKDVRLDVEVEAENVKILVERDDESDFSDDCQMDFDGVKDLWVRKQRKPPWVEVAHPSDQKDFEMLTICMHGDEFFTHTFMRSPYKTIQGPSALWSTVLELIALPGIFGDLLHPLVSRFL